MFELQGCFTALITPFKAGKPDLAALRKLVRAQIAAGVNGLVPCGSTGEAATLTTYIERYRAGDTQVSELTGSTAFFGTGGVAKKRFCYQGKIWYGK